MVDATALERNLFFTLQLLELGLPMVFALNLVDLAARRGIRLDPVVLGERLGLPVVRTVGTSGSGLGELTQTIADSEGPRLLPRRLSYEPAIEAALEGLAAGLDGVEQPYPVRWAALKLLEGDEELLRFFQSSAPTLVARATAERTALEVRYVTRIGTVISTQRYEQAEAIASAVQGGKTGTPRIADRIDRVALHPVLGYLLIAGVLGGLLAWTFTIGAGLSELLVAAFGLFGSLDPVTQGSLPVLLWSGAYTGLGAGVTLVVPFVLRFYLLLAVIEDSGYLTRISVMLDRVMHPLGLHGKAIIPLVMWATGAACRPAGPAGSWRRGGRS